MRSLISGVLALAVVAAGCGTAGSSNLDAATSCFDLIGVDVAELSPAEADRMGDLVLEFAQAALDADDANALGECNLLVRPLDEVGVVVDLVEMDRS